MKNYDQTNLIECTKIFASRDASKFAIFLHMREDTISEYIDLVETVYIYIYIYIEMMN